MNESNVEPWSSEALGVVVSTSMPFFLASQPERKIFHVYSAT